MTPTVKPNQVAGITVRNLTRKVYQSLYQEWLQNGHTGGFDDFLAAIAPKDAIAEAVRAELAGKTLHAPDAAQLAELDKKLAELEKRLEHSGQTAALPDIDGLQAELAQLKQDLADLPLGADGKSAYELAVQNGFSGSLNDYLAALKGDKGDPGEKGADGAPGRDGLDFRADFTDNGDKAHTLNSLDEAAAAVIPADVKHLYINSSGAWFFRLPAPPAAHGAAYPIVQKTADGAFWQRELADGILRPEHLGWDASWNVAKEAADRLDEGSLNALLAKHTALFKLLFQAASQEGLNIELPKNSVWYLNDAVFIDINIKDINGNGATVYFKTGDKTGGFINANDNNGGHFSRKVAGGFRLHHFVIRPFSAADTGVYGFYGRNTSEVEVSDCDILTHRQEPILFLIQPDAARAQQVAGILYNNHVGNNKALRNVIRYDNQDPRSYQANGILFNVDMRTVIGTTDGDVDGMDKWLSDDVSRLGTFPDPGFYHHGATAIGNTVEGARYGVAGFYTRDGAFQANTCRNNVRGVVLQNVCTGMQLTDNRVFDNSSSAILVNYGSSGNVIARNICESSRVTGQAFIHSSVYCTDNIFKDNIARWTGTHDTPAQFPMWGIYIGVGCDRTRLENNTVSGKFRKAAIALESDWVKGDTATESYGSNMDASNPRYPATWTKGAAMADIVIKDNTVLQWAKDYTAVYIRAVQTTPLDKLTFTGNTVRAVDGMRIRVLKDAGAGITNMVMGGNNYDKAPADWKYAIGEKAWYAAISADLGRPSAAWEQTAAAPVVSGGGAPRMLNITLGEDSTFAAPADNNAVIHLQAGASAEAKKLIQITGGQPGQQLIVRWSAGIATEKTDANRIRFINGMPSATALDSNKLTGFLCLAPGVWAETSRNFT